MKRIITFLLIGFIFNVQAQTDSVLIKQVERLRVTKNYSQIIDALSKVNGKGDIWVNYQLACYYSLLNDGGNSFNHLQTSINLGAKGEDILTDTDFDNMHSTEKWYLIVDTLEQIYLAKYPNIASKELAIELWHVYIEDQRFRTLNKNYKKPFPKFGTPEHHDFNKIQGKKVDVIRKRLIKIIKVQGWPTYSMVGTEAADGVFYVFQHSGYKYLKKYLPYLKEAAMSGEASKANYAKMYDRFEMNSGRKQYYGTQIVSSGKFDKDGNYIKGIWQFHPIQDFEKVNERRSEMDLPPIEEYAKRMNVVYNPDANIALRKFKH